MADCCDAVVVNDQRRLEKAVEAVLAVIDRRRNATPPNERVSFHRNFGRQPNRPVSGHRLPRHSANASPRPSPPPAAA